MKRLAIVGAGGHGKVVADTAECCGWDVVEFFEDAWSGREMNGAWRIAGDTSTLLNHLSEYEGVLVAIGDNKVRHAKLAELAGAGAQLVSLIHPDATISRYAAIGIGSVVFAGVVVNADTQVGPGAILNTGCSIDHDCTLGDAVHISPGARLAGTVRVGSMSWIGIGACVRQSLQIGSLVMVGAGAVVVADIADSQTVVGVPAKPR
ncbi:acetyltransferase [Pseudomonas sp. rhizo25]|uniref:acetyltransferase n=1 Tax=Pseudomonas sp. rhizo25 TaxID=3059675 RepID=UPI00288E8508|nr:acetyltransferase [Pseudomonas sp. rhizo25]MDT3232535.1 acetyltransferase [Pseudomonas sp. rhizo25]